MDQMPMDQMKVGIAGFGNVGQEIARRLMQDSIVGTRLVGISSRDLEKTRPIAGTLAPGIPVLQLDELSELCDVVLECATSAALPQIARSVLEKGKHLICISAGGLIDTAELEELSRRHGGRIRIANGAQPSLDILRAVSEGEVASVHLTSIIRPESMFQEKYALDKGLDFQKSFPQERVLVFSGTAREAASHFPRHMNIAVAISIAGIGLDRTTLELWVDPTVEGARNTLDIKSDAAIVTTTIQNVPSRTNKKTSAIVAPSIISALRSLTLPVVSGG